MLTLPSSPIVTRTLFLRGFCIVHCNLSTTPESGAIVPEYNRPDIREVFVHSFRLIYKILPNEILVLTGCGWDGFASGLMPEAKFVVGA